jgi:hypothetical protein
VMKIIRVFDLIIDAIIIQPRLKIEDSAKISSSVFVVICRILPIRVDTSIEITIKGFIMKIIK